MCNILLKKGISVYAFCDNNSACWGEIYQGIPVKDYTKIIKGKQDFIWVVPSLRYYEEIYEQLTGYGILPSDIISFTYEAHLYSNPYYRVLSPKYYENELQMISAYECNRKGMSTEEYFSYLRKKIEAADIADEEYRYIYKKYRLDQWLKSE